MEVPVRPEYKHQAHLIKNRFAEISLNAVMRSFTIECNSFMNENADPDKQEITLYTLVDY